MAATNVSLGFARPGENFNYNFVFKEDDEHNIFDILDKFEMLLGVLGFELNDQHLTLVDSGNKEVYTTDTGSVTKFPTLVNPED